MSTYYYKVFSYNGSASTINYKTTSPLTGSIASSNNMMGSYYSGCNTASNKFLDSLQAKIRRNTTKISYTNYTTTMIADFAYRDTSAGQRVVSCVYSGDNYVYTTFSWYTVGTFSREHTWCHSWMPTYSSTSGAEYSDQHHLFPTEQVHANGIRSNHPEGIVTTVTSSYLNAKIGTNANGNTVYEPQNSHKGNTARALLYMAVRYNGVSGNDWTFNYLNKTTLVALGEDSQSVATLLAWHAADPVDSYEVARNDYVYSIQGNRNPFVDHPEYVNYINFHNVTYSTTGSNKTNIGDLNNGVKNETNAPFKLYAMPNPFNGEVIVSMNSNENLNTAMNIYDITGKLIAQKNIAITYGFNAYTINAEDWPSGIYIIKIEGNGQVVKVVKE
ncbi:MAG: endonuclease [Bacteroidetes bacterium]|nr:endonuclease [Bacteroidota bacterium]